MSRVLIVGLGDFGAVWATLLLERTTHTLFLYDIDLHKAKQVYEKLNKRFKQTGVLCKRVKLISEDVVKQKDLLNVEVVFFAVPPQYFEESVYKWIEILPENAILVDVLSVKVYPFEIFASNELHKFRKVVMHPMFGPNALKLKNSGWPIIYWPVSTDSSEANEKDITEKPFEQSQLENWAIDLIESLQMHPIKLNPYEHDKAMAYTQFLAHLFGVLGDQLARKVYKNYAAIMPGSAKRLMDLSSLAVGLSDDVFNSMYIFNPFAKEAVTNLLEFTLKQLNTFYKDMNNLDRQRELIDIIDEVILYLFALRLETVTRIKQIKDKLGKGIVDKQRYKQHLNSLLKQGKKLGLSTAFITDFYKLLHDESVRFQNNVKKD